MSSKDVLKKPVPHFLNYIVTDSGEIYHERLGRTLTLHTSKLGYHYVVLFPSGKDAKRKGVKKIPSRLIAEAFVPGKSKSNNRVLFKDQNRNNLKATNLFWGSHQLACQRGNTGNHPGFTGQNNPNSKLTAKQVAAIRRLYATGKSSHRILSQKYKVSTTAIYKIINGHTWKTAT